MIKFPKSLKLTKRALLNQLRSPFKAGGTNDTIEWQAAARTEKAVRAVEESMKPGIHQIGMTEYLAIKALSSGLVHTLLSQSAMHAKSQQDDPQDEPSAVSEIGTAIHDVLLEGRHRIAEVPFDDWRTKEAKAQRELARSEGRLPVLHHKVPQIEAAVAAARAFIATSELNGVFDSGKPEQTLVWKEGDVLCKARPDWLTADQSILLHVKTTAGSAQPESWIRNQLASCGYDTALAFYERGLVQTMAMENMKWGGAQSVFLIIEQLPPYGCSLVSLDPAYMELAASKVERAIRTWAECQASGKYPAYPSRIAYATPKPWDLSEEEGRQLGDAFDSLQAERGLQA